MKIAFKKCAAVLTAGVMLIGTFAHFMTRETYAYSFVGQDSNVTTDIKVGGFDTGVDYTRVHLGSGGSSGYGANRIINIVEGNLAENPGLSIETLNVGTYSTSSGKLIDTVNGYSEGRKQILAAVNGDWMSTVTGTLGISARGNYYVSFSSMVLDGEIWCSQMTSQETSADYYTLGMSKDRQIVIGKPTVRTTVKNVSTGYSTLADGVNRAPANNAFFVYNNRLGTSNYISTSSYEVAIRVSGSNKFMNDGTVTGTVIGLYASGTSSRQALTDDVIVLSARGTKMSYLSGKFSVGDTVTVSTYLTQSNVGTTTNSLWKNCEEAIGGQILVMKDGSINNNLTSSEQYPTGIIGTKADGSVMISMITSDTNGVRTGLRYNQIPSFCKAVGYDTCFLLDGGGSTTMITLDENDTYVERACYSDGSARSVWNGVALVYEPPIPTSVFDKDYYYNAYSDMQSAIGYDDAKLFKHFVKNGIKEGRRASAIFDVQYYLENNSDIKSAFGTDRYAAMNHFLTMGYKEPRFTAPCENLGDEFNATIDLVSANLSLGVSGTNVITTNTSSGSKVWKFKRNSDGTYTIVHAFTGKVLDVYGSSYESGANVQIYEANGSSAQSFFIHKTLDGYYTLRPKCSGLTVLDVEAGSTAAGANVQMYTSNGSNAQKFKITAVFSDDEMVFNLKTGTDLTLSENDSELMVIGIDLGTTAATVVSNFEDTCSIYDKSGNVKTGPVRTGDIIKKTINGVEAVRATIIVTGDTNCDGIINGKDLLNAKKSILGVGGSDYPIAADIDRDGTLEQSDLESLTSLIG